ncbi:MAG: ScpA family protein [Pseudomonadota bacterium]
MNDFEAQDDGHGPGKERLVVDLEGYEGPLDVLLALARDQKVDLTRISIRQLADQYLAFIHQARRVRLELAADYLVMAAWLAYLKSRLLLPAGGDEGEPSGPELAAALQFQLRRLEAMRNAGMRLLARPQLGRDFLSRGDPEELTVAATSVYEVSLYDLLKAYADRRRRIDSGTLQIVASNDLYSVDEALQRLSSLIGRIPDWRTLANFLPDDLREGLNMRSAIASTFAASLELAKAGKAELRQDSPFGPIYVRRTSRPSRTGE